MSQVLPVIKNEKGNLMDALVAIVAVVIVGIIGLYYLSHRRAVAAKALEDSLSRARRWVERLGGQVYSLEPKGDPAARQALADAAERFTAAGAQVEQAVTAEQSRLAELTAHEGLYYVRAARVSLGLDPGPELPALPGQLEAGAVTEDRSVTVEGHEYLASPAASDRTPHYHPGGTVANRPVPRGWYSDPWWRSAFDTGSWAVSSYLIASSLFYGTAGYGWDANYATGYQAAEANADDSGHECSDANLAVASTGDFDAGDF
jgi:hypothetical protein